MNINMNISIIFQLKYHLEDKCAKNLKQQIFSEKKDIFELKIWKENILVDEKTKTLL